ncbi:unnamed protein product [Amoebophrya sp. A120]|nr:unnamed protein product [Amoebophrya sp. A120]|eukprot:GSA120T00005455001.1
MKRAMETVGFCRVTGYQYTPALWDRMWALGKQMFRWEDKNEFLTAKDSNAGFPYGLGTMKKDESNQTFDYFSDGQIDKPRLLPTGQDLNVDEGESRRMWKDAKETDFPHRHVDGERYDAKRSGRALLSCCGRRKTRESAGADEDDHSLYKTVDLNQYYNEFAKIAFTVVALLRDSLEVPSELDLEEMERTHWSVMRFLDYPSLPVEKLPTSPELDHKLRPRIPPHEDFGLITILRQDENGGLQVLNKDETVKKNLPEKDWKRHGVYETIAGKAKAKLPDRSGTAGASNVQGATAEEPLQEPLIVNIGRVWDSYTNDKVRATTHKVEPVIVDGRTTARNSHAFFLNPNWVSCFFGPLPQYGGDKKDWINFGMHINNCIKPRY